MIKYSRMQKVVMSVLVTMMVVSLLLAISAFLMPTPALAGYSEWYWVGCDCPNDWSRWRRSHTYGCWWNGIWTLCIDFEHRCEPDC
jgi:hypothetical protein